MESSARPDAEPEARLLPTGLDERAGTTPEAVEEARLLHGNSGAVSVQTTREMRGLPTEVVPDLGANARQGETGPALTRENIPVKAQQYLSRAENAMLRNIKNALDVDRFADRADLKDAVQRMSTEYLETGKVSPETREQLFEQAYEQGRVQDSKLYEMYKDLKDHIRTTPISVSESGMQDIADFQDFRRAAFGTMRISADGTPVDIVYEELRTMAPELFPAGIVAESDQVQRIYDVGKMIRRIETDLNEAYGNQSDDFKRWARNDFEAAVDASIAELNRVRRYARERAAGKTAPEITEQNVAYAFSRIRDARHTMERAKARNLLTDYDEGQVGRLLRGEITLDELNASKVNVKGVREVYEASRDYDRYAETIREYNKQRKANLREEADKLLQTANSWKDKAAGILYSRETMERNVRDIVPNRAVADAIIEKYFTPVHDAEAEGNKFKNEYRDRVRALALSRDVTKGNSVSEAHAVQLLGEASDNLRMLNENGKAGEMRDGKTAQEWEAAIRELWEQNPNLDRAKIENAVKEFRIIYDELFRQMNEVRVRNGYEPVGYRQGYFPHFQPGETEGVMASFAKAMGLDVNVNTLPTSINGLTHTFRPGITWFGNAQERLGFDTAYDAVEGFDKYIEGVSDVIHQTDNIQRLRALASQIRYRTTDEGMRQQMDAIRSNQNLNEEEQRAKLDELYDNGRFTLGNFVVELEEYTNLLANKKSRADRNMEQAMGRRAYTAMKNLESRVAANMVAVNPGSWLTNFIPLTQGWATLDTKTLLRGMRDTLAAYKNDDGMVARSTFLTNRRGSDPIVRTWAQKASAKLSSPMEYIDQFTADTLVRARYAQNVKSGLSEENAIREADVWAAGIMADRSKGSMPTIFNRSNPLTKLFTQFQLEVNNEFSNIFKDVPNELKKKGAAALAAGLLKYFVGAWLYNEVYEYFVGRRAAFDPINLVNDTVGDFTGYHLPNIIEGARGLLRGDGTEVFKTQKTGTYNALASLAGNAAEELPFVGGVLGGGRVPISSALPDWENLAKAAVNDQWDDRKRATTALKELGKPATYLALPFGGGQLRKIYQGIKAVSEGGSYSVDSQGRDILQYPVYNDTTGDIAGSTTRALLFGKSSMPEARKWVESGFDSFGAKQTAVYQGMNEAGVSDRDAYALLREMENAPRSEGESADAAKRHVLQASDISGEGKSVVYYGLLASDKERELMDGMPEGTDMGVVTDALMRYKDANLLNGAAATRAKRDALLGSDLMESEKRMMYRMLVGDGHEDDLDELAGYGLGVDDWMRYERDAAGLNKKEAKLGVIDAMDITNEQKDALYFAAGYGEKMLKDAPWHTGAGTSTAKQAEPRYLAAPDAQTAREALERIAQQEGPRYLPTS